MAWRYFWCFTKNNTLMHGDFVIKCMNRSIRTLYDCSMCFCSNFKSLQLASVQTSANKKIIILSCYGIQYSDKSEILSIWGTSRRSVAGIKFYRRPNSVNADCSRTRDSSRGNTGVLLSRSYIANLRSEQNIFIFSVFVHDK